MYKTNLVWIGLQEIISCQDCFRAVIMSARNGGEKKKAHRMFFVKKASMLAPSMWLAAGGTVPLIWNLFFYFKDIHDVHP